MKLVTLKAYFRRSPRTKLYITTKEFAVSGFVCNPRVLDDSLLVDIGPYLIYSFVRQQIIYGTQVYRGLRLDHQTTITRRLNTHRRHLSGRGLQILYFEQASHL